MTGFLIIFAIAFAAGLSRSARRFRCACDHPHWSLRPHHERLAVMLALMTIPAVCLVASVAQGHRVSSVAILLMLWVDGYRVWIHERDRRRRAARALGRVLVDLHGRLRVAPA